MPRAAIVIGCVLTGCLWVNSPDDLAQVSPECVPPTGDLLASRNGDFEGVACAGWTTNGAVGVELAESSDAHCGVRSCRVCVSDGTRGAVLVATTPNWVPTVRGEAYRYTVFLKAAEGTSDFVAFGTFGDPSKKTVVDSGPVNASPTWQASTAAKTISVDGEVLAYTAVIGPSSSGRKCVLIDDARLVRTKTAP